MILDDYATKAEAAAIIGVDVATLAQWMKKGLVPYERVGREVLILRQSLGQYRRSTRGRKSRVRATT